MDIIDESDHEDEEQPIEFKTPREADGVYHLIIAVIRCLMQIESFNLQFKLEIEKFAENIENMN